MFRSKNYRIKSEFVSQMTDDMRNNFAKGVNIRKIEFSNEFEKIYFKISKNFKDKDLKFLPEIKTSLHFAFDYFNEIYVNQNGINTGQQIISLDYLYQHIRDKDMIKIIRDNCIEILIDSKLKVYFNTTNDFLMKTIDWSFQFCSFKTYHSQLKEELLRSFECDLNRLDIKSLIIKHNRFKLSNKIEESHKFFNKDYNNSIEIYLEEWHKSNPFNPKKTLLSKFDGQHKRLSQNDQVTDIYEQHKLLKSRMRYSNSNSKLIETVIDKLFSIIESKYKDQLMNDLKIIVELVEEKVQGEFKMFLRNDLYNQFKTRNLYKCLIKKTMERMEKIKQFILKSSYSEFISKEILDKHLSELKSRLEGHQDELLSKQRSLYEKFINVNKKCLKESIELYTNLRDENNLKYSDPELDNKMTVKAIEYADRLFSSLKGDFNDECYKKLSDNIKSNIIKELEQIKIKYTKQDTNSFNKTKEIEQVIQQIESKNCLSNNVSDQLKLNTFNRDGLSKYRLELESARAKLNFALRRGNISGVKRRAIDEQLLNTKQLLNSNVIDRQKYQNQTKHLDDLLKLINK